MSVIEAPDPHPGRCLNLRPCRDVHGYPTTKRCLGYEDHDGACHFPADPLRASQVGNQTYTQRKPEPWISPLERFRV